MHAVSSYAKLSIGHSTLAEMPPIRSLSTPRQSALGVAFEHAVKVAGLPKLEEDFTFRVSLTTNTDALFFFPTLLFRYGFSSERFGQIFRASPRYLALTC